jgi:hypothetical protein
MNRRDFLLSTTGLLLTPILAGAEAPAQSPESAGIPAQIKVKPVLMVPSDGPAPTSRQTQALRDYLHQAQERYRELLSGNTFSLASEEPQIVRIDKPLDYFNRLPFPDSGEHPALLRMFEFDRVEGNGILARGPRPDGSLFWDYGDWKQGGRLVCPVPNLEPDAWQHFAFVASRTPDRMLVYRNGRLLAQKQGVSAYKPGDHDLYVGCGRFPFNGDIREFRVWSKVRSQREIQQEMEKTLNATTPGLIAYYRGQQPSR